MLFRSALLEKENTFAIVTGQQVGIFLGPMYTIYKTLTAIKVAEKMKILYPDKNFVPVFWLEGEDHDFREVNNITVMNLENKLQKFSYFPGGIPTENNLGATGKILFDFFFNDFSSSIFSALQKTEFSEQFISLFSRCYRDGVTF